MSVIDDLTRIAKGQIGNNGSKYRKWFYNRTSDYYGVNWCAVFISWLFNQVNGLGKYIIKSDGAGSVPRESIAAGLKGTWYESEYSAGSTQPRAGDIVVFTWNGIGRVPGQDKYYSNHIGYVYAVDNSYIYTIEGNTGSDNADYSVVAYRQYSRTSGKINGYYRPYYNQKEEKEMNFKKGDKSDGVLAYKSLLQQGQKLGIIKSKVDNTNSFGGGTYKATLEVQRKYKLEVDGIAGVKTITALRNAINTKITATPRFKQLKTGDWNLGVYAVKRSLQTAHAAGIIKSNCDSKNGFGTGTEKCVKEIQKIACLKPSGIVDKGVINAINNLIEKRLTK